MSRYTQIDGAFHRRFKFILEFPMPDAAARARLWRQVLPARFIHLHCAATDVHTGHCSHVVYSHRVSSQLVPKETPISDDVDFPALGERFELTGGAIKNSVFRAAVEVTRC